MDESTKELFKEKLEIALKLIRSNNTADEVLKISQAVNYLVRAQEFTSDTNPEPRAPETKPRTTKRQGASS